MLIEDLNLKKLLQRIQEAGKIPEKLMVIKCTECGDTIFIPVEQNQETREYWKEIYLDNRCRYHKQTECQGFYQEVKLTLEKVEKMLKPDKPEQLFLPIIIPPNKRSN